MHLRPIHYFLIFVLLISLACNLPASIISQNIGQDTPSALAYLLVTADVKAQATPTPFQPIIPTATSVLSDGNTSIFLSTTDPTASITPTSTIQYGASRVNQGEGVVNILLMGSDARPDDPSYRTDVILWLSLNPKMGTATLISFPRDLWVYIPGWGDNRINTAQLLGFGVTQETFLYNFGIKPDHYILTSFTGFETIIDTLGGIDVYASLNLTDSCDLPQAVNGMCSVGPGLVHMNGATALWYARARHTTSDFDRTRRAQEVVLAGFRRLMSLNAVSKAGTLYGQFKNAVQTDMTLSDALPLLSMASQLTDASRIKRFAIGPSEVYNWVTPEGWMVLVPVQSACQVVIEQAFATQ